MTEENRHEAMMKKAQLTIGVLVGIVTLVVGVYNAKNLLFLKKGPGAVSIQVHGNGNQPVPQASVQISRVQGGIVADVETNGSGEYARKGLEPGSYSLKVSKAGFQPEALVFAVDPGQTAEVNLALKSSSTPIGSALEEVGSSWIREVGKPKPKPEAKSE